jgi:AbrB family looped-hinge helix DNA binding protein
MSKEQSKVTSKRQVTLPKAIADRYGIRTGDSLGWVPDGDHIRVSVGNRSTPPPLTAEERLRLFDEASARRDSLQREGAACGPVAPADSDRAAARGWTREDVNERSRAG